MVQNVRMNPYFDILSKIQTCQRCHLRPCCIQPTMCHIRANEFLDSNFNEAVIDKI